MCTTVVPRLLPLQLHCVHLEHHQGNRAQYCPLVSASDYYWPTEKWQNNVFRSQNTFNVVTQNVLLLFSLLYQTHIGLWSQCEHLSFTYYTTTVNSTDVYLAAEKHGSTERHHRHYECQPDDQICWRVWNRFTVITSVHTGTCSFLCFM